MSEVMTLIEVRDILRNDSSPGWAPPNEWQCGQLAEAIDAHITQPAHAVDVGLVERLRKRAGEERTIAANNARVAELLAPELALFEAKEGHNIYATRMAIDHRDSAKRDAAFADDLEAAATALTRALGNAQAEGWREAVLLGREAWEQYLTSGGGSPIAHAQFHAAIRNFLAKSAALLSPTPPQPEE